MSAGALDRTNRYKLFKSRRSVAPAVVEPVRYRHCVCIYILRSAFDQQRLFSHYHFNGINQSANTHHTHSRTCCSEQTYCNNTVVWKFVRIRYACVCVCVTSLLPIDSLLYFPSHRRPCIAARR